MQAFVTKNPDLFEPRGSDPFSQLGTFKVDHGSLPEGELDFGEEVELPSDFVVPLPQLRQIEIEGEADWKTSDRFLEQACEDIMFSRRVMIEGGAGYGKSRLVKHLLLSNPAKQHLVLNFCTSLINDVWSDFTSRTVDSCLGMVFNPESGSMENRSGGINLRNVDILVLDECYMVSLENLARLRDKIETQNPDMVVVYMGDPHQNELIVKNAHEHVRPITESQEEIFRELAPFRIRLRVNKRSPEDQQKIEAITKMLFEDKMPHTKVLDCIIRKGWVNTVSSFDEICSVGIDTHVCYFQKKPIALGRRLHEHYGQPSGVHQVHNGKSFLKRRFFGRDIGTECTVKITDDGDKKLVATFDNGVVIATLEKALDDLSDLRDDGIGSLAVLKDCVFQEIGVYRVRCHVKGLVKNDLVKLVSSTKTGHRFQPLVAPSKVHHEESESESKSKSKSKTKTTYLFSNVTP